MNAADNPQLELLFNASARDEQTLQFEVPDEIFGFHAQQAIEKLFKAFITAHGERHHFTHDLRKLLTQLRGLGEVFPSFPLDWKSLTDYALDVRYESGTAFSPGQREEMRDAIAELRSFVMKRVEELARAGTQIRET